MIFVYPLISFHEKEIILNQFNAHYKLNGGDNMPEVEELQKLVDIAHVRKDVLAQFCNCTPTSIQNYVKGYSVPNGTKLMGIKDGLKKYRELINSIIVEE